MRIISNEHDYYDCVQRVDHDRSLIYQRHPVRTEWEKEDWPFPDPPFADILRLGYPNLKVDTVIVGFCGKIYPLIEMTLDTMTPRPTACWSLADVDAYLKSILIEDAWKEYCDEKKRYRRHRWYSLAGRRKKCREFFEECKNKESSFAGLFEKHKCPIFVASWRFRIDFEANALLAPLGFYRIFDTNRAWMEISQYVSNQALPIKPMPVLDDATLLECKGFDKYSFRKDPIKSKPKS